MSIDPSDPKPEVFALIAWPLDRGDVLLTKQDRVPLEDAVTYSQLGFAVLVDPADEALLAEWERMQRALKRKWTW